jgi:hypothetical protein
MGRVENTAPHCCSSVVSVATCLFAKPLFSNGFSIFAYIAVVAQKRVYMLQYNILSCMPCGGKLVGVEKLESHTEAAFLLWRNYFVLYFAPLSVSQIILCEASNY